MTLASDFLAPYRRKRDVFPDLLSRSVYLSKYCRDGETWTDTCRRVVEANITLDPEATRAEAEALFDAFWKMKLLPPGRGLFTGGISTLPIMSRYNCAAFTLKSISDFQWLANRLLEGVGVGVGLSAISGLPCVQSGHPRLAILCSTSHPNEGEFATDEIIDPNSRHYVVEDSRIGWASALRLVLDSAWSGDSITVNVSSIRPRGAPIRTFGGYAPGPGPLVELLRQVWSIVRSRTGGRLSDVNCLDIINHIGACIRSGGVRRSAIIVLGDSNSYGFRTAKHGEALPPHRSSSNNSVALWTESDVNHFDWSALVDNCANWGEPGFVNMWKIRQTDNTAVVTNPCSEACLADYDFCCLANMFPSRWSAFDDKDKLTRLITRYAIRQRLEVMEDPLADKTRRKLMRIGVGIGGLCDFKWTKDELTEMYQNVRFEATSYARHLGVNPPITCTVVKPDGTVSSLVGTSSGVHAAYAPYYIRRIRIMDSEPMFGALVDAGVPVETCVYDTSGHTGVFEIPMQRNASAYTHTETVEQQLKRVIAVQDSWTDQAVSTTLSFGEDEKRELSDMLRVYGPNIKTLSMLPRKHSYQQAPFEEITEEEYMKRLGKVDMDHPLVYSDDAVSVEECSTGICPVR